MVENGSHPKGKFQAKFQEFQKACRVSEEVLETIIQPPMQNDSDSFQFSLRDRTAKVILAQLQDGSQAKRNLDFILGEKYPNAIQVFLENQDSSLSTGIRCQQLSDFLARLAQNAPTPDRTTVMTAPLILKNVITDLLNLFEGELYNRKLSRNDSHDTLREAIFEQLQNLINTREFRLKDPITDDKEPSAIFGGIMLFLRDHLKFLKSHQFEFNQAAAVENQIKNLLEDKICGSSFTEQSVIEILKPGFPDSLWEIACLQAGILEYHWEEKNND